VYQPVTDSLPAHPDPEVTLTFGQLEALLGALLPAQAWTRGWWRNEPVAEQTHAWLVAGWRVRWVRRSGDATAVTFVRPPVGRAGPQTEPRRAP
jgi:hypothetical protein